MYMEKKSKKAVSILVLIIVAIIFAVIGFYHPSENTNHDYTYFTNKYGTPTTKCHHSGCNNRIASSGNTNCCVEHSRHCLNCYCYIDEDALYCMDCLERALK